MGYSIYEYVYYVYGWQDRITDPSDLCGGLFQPS